jgi:hypothetical protein
MREKSYSFPNSGYDRPFYSVFDSFESYNPKGPNIMVPTSWSQHHGPNIMVPPVLADFLYNPPSPRTFVLQISDLTASVTDHHLTYSPFSEVQTKFSLQQFPLKYVSS